jgi:hypothetical protein
VATPDQTPNKRGRLNRNTRPKKSPKTSKASAKSAAEDDDEESGEDEDEQTRFQRQVQVDPVSTNPENEYEGAEMRQAGEANQNRRERGGVLVDGMLQRERQKESEKRQELAQSIVDGTYMIRSSCRSLRSF